MKKSLKLILAVLACASLSLPVFAQDESAPGDGQQDQSADQQPPAPPAEAPAARPPAPKPAAKKAGSKKKKAVKRKKEKEVSEYKFTSDEPTATYKFDKKAEPILKKSKTKKKAGKKGEAASAGTTVKPKLQKVKSIGEEDAPAAPGAGGAANPLAGMNIPGMGGK